MIKQKQSINQSFFRAWEGVVYALRSGRNIRIQVTVGITIIILGWVVSLSRIEWVIITLLISEVILAECFNTAIEILADLLEPRIHEHVKLVKDVSAAAVFIASVGAIIVGLITFLPHFI